MTFIVHQVLDDCVRANENPLNLASGGDSWAQVNDHVADSIAALKIVSNKIVQVTPAVNNFMFLDADYSDDNAIAVDINALGVNNTIVNIVARMAGQGTNFAAVTGYALRWTKHLTTTPDVLELGTFVGGVFTLIGAAYSVPLHIAIGEGIGISVVGDRVRAYYKTPLMQNDWLTILDVTDATYATGDRIGLHVPGTNIASMSNVFGGEFVAPTEPTQKVDQEERNQLRRRRWLGLF